MTSSTFSLPQTGSPRQAYLAPDSPARYLRGVGEQRSGMLARLGIRTLSDLIHYPPRDWLDRKKPARIAATADGQTVFVEGEVLHAAETRISATLTALKAAISDGTGTAFLTWIRRPARSYDVFKSLKEKLAHGNRVRAWGRAQVAFGRREIQVSELEAAGPEQSAHFGRIVPLYDLTEGLSGTQMREWVAQALEHCAGRLREWLPDDVMKRQSLPQIKSAVRQIHFPDDFGRLEAARRRLAFDEILLPQIGLARSRCEAAARPKAVRLGAAGGAAAEKFVRSLPFKTTGAQDRAVREILSDMRSEKPMSRLLQGEVGSGKTAVAGTCIAAVLAENGCACIMAPTEILAEQHFLTLRRLMPDASVMLVRGQMSGGQKRDVDTRMGDMRRGHLIVGTHAILTAAMQSRRIRLVIIDEQHRFGVSQRMRLMRRPGAPVDTLVMTATPIPRTLALTLYADMDQSIMDEMPAGRTPVETVALPEELAYEHVRSEAARGRQAYIVYPVVDNATAADLKTAVAQAEKLPREQFRGMRVGLLHGRMPPERKDAVLVAFARGEFQVLIATTVVEVGIDVPNATVMVIEHAERYGLATLHQLRGRVGRGPHGGKCILVANPQTDDARKRLQMILSTSNGLEIAEKDLELRGPGDIFGPAQHGIFEMRFARLSRDADLVEVARHEAGMILKSDPDLLLPEHAGIRDRLQRRIGDRWRAADVA